MPEFIQSSNVTIFLAILFPGIVSMYTLQLLTGKGEIDWKNALCEAAFWGTLNFAAVACCRVPCNWFLPCLLICPLLGPFLYSRIMFLPVVRKRFQLPYRTAFDHALAAGRLGNKIIYVHMKDGSTVIGYFHYPDSFASTFPDSGDLYLSHAFEFTDSGEFQPKPQTAGIVVKSSEWSYLEMFEI